MGNELTLDAWIKRLFPVGMRSRKDVELQLHCGFERANTKPYHNYETWSHEWEAWINGRFVVKAETLEELVTLLEVNRG